MHSCTYGYVGVGKPLGGIIPCGTWNSRRHILLNHFLNLFLIWRSAALHHFLNLFLTRSHSISATWNIFGYARHNGRLNVALADIFHFFRITGFKNIEYVSAEFLLNAVPRFGWYLIHLFRSLLHLFFCHIFHFLKTNFDLIAIIGRTDVALLNFLEAARAQSRFQTAGDFRRGVFQTFLDLGLHLGFESIKASLNGFAEFFCWERNFRSRFLRQYRNPLFLSNIERFLPEID